MTTLGARGVTPFSGALCRRASVWGCCGEKEPLPLGKWGVQRRGVVWALDEAPVAQGFLFHAPSTVLKHLFRFKSVDCFFSVLLSWCWLVWRVSFVGVGG